MTAQIVSYSEFQKHMIAKALDKSIDDKSVMDLLDFYYNHENCYSETKNSNRELNSQQWLDEWYFSN